MNSEAILDRLFMVARDLNNGHNVKNNRYKLAAALVNRREFLSFGNNSFEKTHSFQVKFSRNKAACYWHAETHAIYNAIKAGVSEAVIAKSTLYVARSKVIDNVKKIEGWGIARPCENCMNCIRHYGIKNVVYTNDQDNGTKIYSHMSISY